VHIVEIGVSLQAGAERETHLGQGRFTAGCQVPARPWAPRLLSRLPPVHGGLRMETVITRLLAFLSGRPDNGC
jgi:hypothetical protein